MQRLQHHSRWITAALLLLWTLSFPAAAQLMGKSRVRMGVVLPLKEKSQRGAKMVEFYQGMLMAVDSMCTEGLSTEVLALHSGSSASEMEALLASDPLYGCDVVFGPLDHAQLPALADYCHQRQIRLVVPFVTQDTEIREHPLCYMASASRPVVQRQAALYFQSVFPDANVVAIETSDPNEEGRRLIEAVRNDVSARGVFLRQLPADFNELSMDGALIADKHNVLIPDGSSLKALNGFMTRLLEYHRQNPEVQISLFGYPSWQTYTQQFLQDFYFLDTYIYTTFFRNPLSPQTFEFDARYLRWFKHPMQNTVPRYAQIGFDLGYYFLRGLLLYGNQLEESHALVTTNPYQNTYWFERLNEGDGFTNNFVELIHYTPYQTTDILSRTR